MVYELLKVFCCRTFVLNKDSADYVTKKALMFRGVTRGSKGGTIPRAPHYYGGAESLPGAPNDCGCPMYILQYSKLASARSQVWTWWGQTCFLLRAPS